MDPALVTLASARDLPVRVVEWMRMRLYQSAGLWWVGAGSLRASDVIQPIAGPLAVRGLSFGWLDGSGNAGVPFGARLLELRLLAAPAAAGPGRVVAADTLRIVIALRNGGTP